MGFHDCSTDRGTRPDKLAKHAVFATPQMFLDVWCLAPGQGQDAHAHAGSTKFYFVLEGRGRFTAGGEERELGPGGVCWAEAAEPHGVRNDSDERLVLLVGMAPRPGA